MNFFHTHVSPSAIERAIEVLRTGWLSEGRQVQAFESALTSRLNLPGPVALNSGTSALHLALVIAGVGPGDEVILPAQTFIATGLAILMQGAIPVFADVDPETGNLAPSDVATRITEKTKALMPVHWGGNPCDMDELAAVGAPRRLALVEDAAHALGAVYKDRPVGALSRFTAFSFQAIKHLTTGDGGLLCCPDDKDRAAALRLRWFGIDRHRDMPTELGERAYDLLEVGYKYHMNDLAAAMGLGNLEDFPARLHRRREIDARYRAELGHISGLRLLRADPDRSSACWLFTVLVDRRLDFIRKLANANVPTSVVHQRIDRNTVFGGIHHDLTGQRRFDDSQVALPLHEALTDDDVTTVVRTIQAGW